MKNLQTHFINLAVGHLWIIILLLTSCQLIQNNDSTPLPPIITKSPSPLAYESLTAVHTAAAPARDMVALAAQLRHIDAPRVAQTNPTPYHIGDTITFWFKENGTENRQIEARLAYQSAQLNMWVQTGVRFNQDTLEQAAAYIEEQILPTNRAFFGTEWQPGIDGDNRLHLLHLEKIGGLVGAYFSAADEVVTAVNPFSNQKELLYISLEEAPLASDAYYATIAHEFQHLIQWHTDKNEDAWLNEGLAELAAHVNGFPIQRQLDYINQTDIQLTTLTHQPDTVAAHYAAASLFALYFLDRFGDTATHTLVRHPQNGITGFNHTLAAIAPDLSFDTLFADWLAATYLTSIGRGEGVYQYQDLAVPAMKPEQVRRFPAQGMAAVHQYGADFYQLNSDEPLMLIFTGTQQVNLLPTEPHNGRYFWATLPADESHLSLTRSFDLTNLVTATLTFWTWYQIEAGWDYGYLSVSTDNGRSWELLETQSTTTDNPQGNSFGPGYTGSSGGGEQPIWVQETADLSPYTGQSVHIRFQYITDGAVHEAGFVLDDITIPQLNFVDGGEEPDQAWEAVGFVRSGPQLPQHFMIQRILLSETAVQVEPLQLDENQQGRWLFPMDKETNTAILIIAGGTPITRQTAVYAYEIRHP